MGVTKTKPMVDELEEKHMEKDKLKKKKIEEWPRAH